MMKLENSSEKPIASKNSAPNLLMQQAANNTLMRQNSSGSIIQRRNQNNIYQRRPNLPGGNRDFTNNSSSTCTVPLLNSAMSEFFRATKIMEDEIMLPSRLKDMPVDEVVLDNSVQPNNWHELYTFVRDIRNQLTRSSPFVDDNSNSTKQQQKDSNDDEGILITNYDTRQHSSASSTVSSDELERSSTTSSTASFDTIRDDLKYHFFGLISSLDNLRFLANRVTEKYTEDSTFKY